MRKSLAMVLVVVMVLASTVGVVSAFDFISTNEENKASDLPHVNVVDVGQDWIELDFVNPTPWSFAFEYRVDGEDTPYPGSVHPITGGDWYHVVNVDGQVGQHLVNMTINADEKVEVRLALGAENDWYFDWTEFKVLPRIVYRAAPAIASDLLEDADVSNRYGQGRNGGNFIANVTRHMGPGTDFMGIPMTDARAYECAIAQFLNDPDNHDGYSAGVSTDACMDQYEEFQMGLEVDSKVMTGVDSATLEDGVKYKFVASGTWKNGNVHTAVDAEYRLPVGSTVWERSAPRSLRLQVNEEYVNWGDEFNPEHIYEIYYTGDGTSVNFRINDGDPPVADWYNDNNGSLFVDIYKVNW